ncbi:hypothetical protein [Chryseolinea lacunae]|uniref:Uncharacterized protein n=1 Tax=Chryseolinea lacunae TaxID=2801331 RepID=A0ABS1KWQ6_9BACT|nr:hypothetical protein [Chryseolinea lacunae]MBL0743844.1 hypothetical protein [Chryseolinea lacunae]
MNPVIAFHRRFIVQHPSPLTIAIQSYTQEREHDTFSNIQCRALDSIGQGRQFAYEKFIFYLRVALEFVAGRDTFG